MRTYIRTRPRPPYGGYSPRTHAYARMTSLSRPSTSLPVLSLPLNTNYFRRHMGGIVLLISMLMSTLQNVGSYTGRAYENPYMWCLISTRKLCTLVISMLMSTLQNVGTYTGRAYENPYIGCLISTRKLCTLVISMLMSPLQNVGTYTGRAYENPYMGCLISTRKLCILVISMLMSILQNVGTYGACL